MIQYGLVGGVCIGDVYIGGAYIGGTYSEMSPFTCLAAYINSFL